MTDEQLQEIFKVYLDGRVGTHWEGCWKSHPACAMALLGREVVRLQEENAKGRDLTIRTSADKVL